MRPCPVPSSSFVPLPAASTEDGADQKTSRFANWSVQTVSSLTALDKSKLPVCIVFPKKTFDEKLTLSFLKAAESGRVEVIQGMLDNKFYPDERGSEGRTALLNASRAGHVDIVRLLLNKGANIDAFDDEKRTALHVALDVKQQAVVDFLLSRNPNVNVIDSLGRSPLSIAIERKQSNAVKQLIQIGADVDHSTDYGWPIFLLAVNTGCLEIFKQLIPLVDVNLTNRNGRSALHLSALSGNLEMMSELIKWGVDIDQPGDAGRSALYYTVINELKECFKLLYEKGADLNDTLTRCCISEARLLRQMEITQASIEKRNFLIAQLSAEWNKLTLL